MSTAPLPIRFIGHHDVSAEGKFLWEILCQLKNFGVGRCVTKSEWLKKWPNQSSYLRIIKTRPDMDRWLHGGLLWAEWTFRDRDLGVYRFASDLNRSDWQLIHKHEEKELLNNQNQMPFLEVPESMPLPPLQKMLLRRRAAREGKAPEEVNDRIPMEMCIDPQFELYRPFIRRVEPTEKSDSIYAEANPETFLDLYGRMLPPKVEAWMVGPAHKSFKFLPEESAEKL